MTQEMLVSLITYAYAFVGVTTLVAYIPQIWTLVIATGRSHGLSISAWLVWTFNSAISFAYMLIATGDIMTIAVSFIGFAGTTIVTALAMYNRYIRFADAEPSRGLRKVRKPKEAILPDGLTEAASA